MAKKLYLIGSLKNPNLPYIGNQLRLIGFDVFDVWWGGGYEADLWWQEYERIRGRTYAEALYDIYATHIWEFDKHHLDTSDLCVMIHPVGRSAHIEFGYMIGQGKPGYVYFDKEPETYDVMYRFADGIFFSTDEMVAKLANET